MKRPAAAAALALLLLAGCTRLGTSAGARGNPWTRHHLLRIVNLSEPDTLNPLLSTFQVSSDLAQFWAGMFFNWSDRNEFVAELATEVPTLANGGVSRDGKTITYHLRKGVLWQDGAPFTADDVIFTWHAILNKKNNVGSTVGYDVVTAIDKDQRDPMTIHVRLRRPLAPFISEFFAPGPSPYPVLPAHLLAQYPDINRVPFNSQPVGTGPFIVQRWQRGQKIVFRANPHYWRGPPRLKEIWYTPVPNENTIMTLLQSHDADLEYGASPRNFEQLTRIAGTRFELTPFTSYGLLAFNLKNPILADVAVRRALWYATNNADIVRDVTHGVNQTAYTDQPEFSWAYNPNTAHYPFDPAKADALLDAAGWKSRIDGYRSKNGQQLTLVIAGVSGSAVSDALDVLLQREWREIGVDLQIKTYTSSLFLASYGVGGIVQGGKFDVASFSWVNGTDPDDSTQFMCDQVPPAGQNVYRFCDPELDAVERVAVSSYDQAVRKRAYDRIQAILADRVPFIVNWFTRRVAIYNTDLRNYRPAHAVTSFWNPYEWDI